MTTYLWRCIFWRSTFDAVFLTWYSRQCCNRFVAHYMWSVVCDSSFRGQYRNVVIRHQNASTHSLLRMSHEIQDNASVYQQQMYCVFKEWDSFKMSGIWESVCETVSVKQSECMRNRVSVFVYMCETDREIVSVWER